MSKEQKVTEIIGANIQIYGHFAIYNIPYEDSSSITNESDVTKEEFIRLTYDYYHSDRLNANSGDDVKESNQIKRFIIKRINNSSYEIGKNWLENQKFKVS